MPNPNFPLDSGGLRVGGVVDPYDAGTVAYYPRGRGTASGGTTFTRDSRELAVYSEGWQRWIGTILSFGTAGTAMRVGTANLAQRLVVGAFNNGTVGVYIGARSDVGGDPATRAGWLLGTAPNEEKFPGNKVIWPLNAGTTLYMAAGSGTATVYLFEAG